MVREAERECKEEEDRRDQEALEAITSIVSSKLEDNLFNRLIEVFRPLIQAMLQQSGTSQGRIEGGSSNETPHPPSLEREKAFERGGNQADEQRSCGRRSRRSRMSEDSDPSSSLSDEGTPRTKRLKNRTKKKPRQLYEDSDLDSEDSGDDDSALEYNRVKLELELNEKEQAVWFNQMKLELQDQGFWKVVRVGMRLLKDKETEEMDEFFQGKNSRKDACARVIIRSNINSADRRSTRGCKTAAELWNHLKEEYCQITRRDRGRAILSLMRWKMNPEHTICVALEELENLNHDVKDVNGWAFEKEFILYFFVEQMPKQYTTVQNTLYGREELTRKDVIAALREKQESLQVKSPNDTANRVRDLNKVECYNCKENGHFKRDCTKPPKNSQDTKKKNRKPSRKDGKRKNKKRDKARRAEDSDGDGDEQGEDVGSSR